MMVRAEGASTSPELEPDPLRRPERVADELAASSPSPIHPSELSPVFVYTQQGQGIDTAVKTPLLQIPDAMSHGGRSDFPAEEHSPSSSRLPFSDIPPISRKVDQSPNQHGSRTTRAQGLHHRHDSTRILSQRSTKTRRSLSYSEERNLPNNGPWQSGEDLRFPLSKSSPEDENSHWETIHALGRDYNKERCAAWRHEIDKVMVFAGLFSAVVMGFIAFTHVMLKEDSQVALNRLVHHLATQMDIYTSALKKGDLGTAPFSLLRPEAPYKISGSALRQNGFLFSSLTVALSTALIGWTCLQWITEYERNPRLGPKEGVGLQQMRLDGINYWRVPEIISLLPILLQIALGLFFWALCEFLANLNNTIACVTVVYIGVVFFLSLLAITLPSLQAILISRSGMKGHQVPFKSPQGRWLSIIAFWWAGSVIWALRKFWPRSLKRKQAFLQKLRRSLSWKSEGWFAFDIAWQREREIELDRVSAVESRDVPRAIAWVATTYVHSRHAITAVHGVLRDLYPSTSMAALRRLFSDHGRPSTRLERFVRDLKGKADGTDEEEVLTDVIGALALTRMVTKNPQLRLGLLDVRAELFVRIINHNAHRAVTPLNIWTMFKKHDKHDKHDHGDSEEWEIGILSPFSTTPNDAFTIADSLKAQLLKTFRAYIHPSLACYHEFLWKIVLPMVIKITTATSLSQSRDLWQELRDVNRDLNTFMGQERPFLHRAACCNHLARYTRDWDEWINRSNPLPPTTGPAYAVEALAHFSDYMRQLKETLCRNQGNLRSPRMGSPDVGKHA